jgi:hypothetical protein
MLQRSMNVRLLMAAQRFKRGAGALGFRDFPGLLTVKENRTGSRQTLLPNLPETVRYGWEASCFSDSATSLRKAWTAGTEGESRASFR